MPDFWFRTGNYGSGGICGAKPPVSEKHRSQALALASSRPKPKRKSGTRRKNDLKDSPGTKPPGMRVVSR